MTPAPTDSPQRTPRDPSSRTVAAGIISWIGINPATCNQFRMLVPEASGRMIGARAKRVGLGGADPGAGGLSVRPRDWQFSFQEQYLRLNTSMRFCFFRSWKP
jgi:hypothetical protein